MIIGENFVFVHVPKCGGMSVTRWILNNVDGPLTAIVPENTFEHTRKMALFDDVLPRLTLLKGKRHETLPDTKATLDRLGLSDPEFVISIIRDPYDLMRSYFHYLQQPHIVKRHAGKFPRQQRAIEAGFEVFCQSCRFFGYDERGITNFFRHPTAFKTVDLVPLQNISTYLESRFSTQSNIGRYSLEKRNSTSKNRMDPVDEARIRNQVYARFQGYYKIYQSALDSQWT